MGSSNSGVGLSSFSIIFFIALFLFLTINPSSSVQVCKPALCGVLGPPVRFPFRLIDEQDERCGYPGFDLYCNNKNQTILSLPHSGEFVVEWISYSGQAIYINDPGNCLPNKISNFSAHGSAFRAASGHKYKFFNCSLDWSAYLNIYGVPLICQDNNSTILVTRNQLSQQMPSTCSLMANFSVPLQFFTITDENFIDHSEPTLELIWDEPTCQSCEQKGWYCGFASGTGLDIGCSKPPRQGLSRGARYGIILGAGIPGLVCLIGLSCYVLGKFRHLNRRRSLDTVSSSAAALNPNPSVTISGLDESTIESYPKTVVGESRRLPKQCDGCCPICLSEYQPKETLRSIPECNHYFHASCIEEWLKRNGTCPLCRNSPESNSMTPCSSRTSTFSISSPA